MSGQKKLLFLAIILGATGLIMFYYQHFVIPTVIAQTEAKVTLALDENAMPRQRVAVITDTQGVARYSVITEEILQSSITFTEVPKKYVIANPATTASQIQGKISKEDLRYGEQIALDSLSAEVKWFEEYERLKEYHIVGTVADTLQSGNLIDVIVNYENGYYDVVVAKIRVQERVRKAQRDENTVNMNHESIIILAVDEEAYADLLLAQQLGVLETRIYLDESQPASDKTLERAWAIEMLEHHNEEENRMLNYLR